MAVFVIFAVLIAVAFAARAIFGARDKMAVLGDKAAAVANATAKLKANVQMFRSGIATERLRRGANESGLQYYIGYITALARCIAEADGVAPDGVVLATVQVEASRLFGINASKDGDYAEGIELLPKILLTSGAREGQYDGELDGRYVIDRNNPGPYFGRLRSRFDVGLPGQSH